MRAASSAAAAARASGAASSRAATAGTTLGFSRLTTGFASLRLAHTSLLEKLLFAR